MNQAHNLAPSMVRLIQTKSLRVPTRVLGKTGVAVSLLGFGTGPAGYRLATKDAVTLYETAFAEGINYFDTAPTYAKAQEQLSYLLKQVRPQVFVATKCYEPSGERALKVLDQSLKELGTPYADFVYVHNVGGDKMDPRVVFGKNGTYAALVRAKSLGLTRFVGLSGHHRPQRFVEALRYFDVDVLLNAVNFVDRHTYNFEKNVWGVAAKANVGLIAMKVFGGESAPKPNILSQSKVPSKYHDMAFRYALSQDQVSCAVIGMVTLRELMENLRRARTFRPLSVAEARQIHGYGSALARQWTDHLGPVV